MCDQNELLRLPVILYIPVYAQNYTVYCGCSRLTSVTIPNSVAEIGPVTFYACSADLAIYGTVGSYAETFAYNESIKFVAV